MLSLQFNPTQSPFSGGAPMCACGASSQMGSSQMMVVQMMQIMMGLMQMMLGGNHLMAAGHPSFGSGASGMNGGGHSMSPSGFLGMPHGTNGNSSAGASSGPSHSGNINANVGSPQSAGGGYVKPLDGNFRISSGFGPRRAPTAGASTFHKGVDLAAPTGTPVRAVKPGRISISTHQTSGGRSTGYGNWIEVKHDDGTSSRYGHLNARNAQVGQRVEAGQVIGTVGNTGTSTGAHLHFEVRNAQGQAVDPQKVMKF